MSEKAEAITINIARLKGGKKIVQADKDSDLTEDQLYKVVRMGEQLHKADEFYKKITSKKR